MPNKAPVWILGGLVLVLGIAGAAFDGRTRSAVAPPAAPQGPLRGTAAAVVTGDTFAMNDQRIRLFGIDAPEMDTPGGVEAAQYLAAVVADRAIVCEDTGERSLKRVVARCLDPWGRDIGGMMVEAGWAFDWREMSEGAYAVQQQTATQRRRGMFAGVVETGVASSPPVVGIPETNGVVTLQGSHTVPSLEIMP